MAVEAKYTKGDEEKIFTGSKEGVKIEDTDRNAMQEPSNTKLGDLRREIMSVQKQVNVFLTERMEAEKNGKTDAEELERKMLDGNDEEAEE
ncbi:hypothetical protein TRICI_003275 [Trichomonascus ciferrii]|uniref:EKC/KEOPS complex subunit GON7 n=1 Tax=Trichomonascus ciferrii TaxID=44093 RepID=A0A642V4E5_9ASCO|nr:hypothetical protein TRICI_003275 [Trichomonascus ciferrii]